MWLINKQHLWLEALRTRTQARGIRFAAPSCKPSAWIWAGLPWNLFPSPSVQLPPLFCPSHSNRDSDTAGGLGGSREQHPGEPLLCQVPHTCVRYCSTSTGHGNSNLGKNEQTWVKINGVTQFSTRWACALQKWATENKKRKWVALLPAFLVFRKRSGKSNVLFVFFPTIVAASISTKKLIKRNSFHVCWRYLQATE